MNALERYEPIISLSHRKDLAMDGNTRVTDSLRICFANHCNLDLVKLLHDKLVVLLSIGVKLGEDGQALLLLSLGVKPPRTLIHETAHDVQGEHCRGDSLNDGGNPPCPLGLEGEHAKAEPSRYRRTDVVHLEKGQISTYDLAHGPVECRKLTAQVGGTGNSTQSRVSNFSKHWRGNGRMEGNANPVVMGKFLCCHSSADTSMDILTQ
jgi:hypothetical protein